MRIVISGSSGLIGSALVADLRSRGHDVVRLVRGAATAADAVSWEPAAGVLAPGALAGVDAVVNLNGRNIGQGRWTGRLKNQLWSSRLQSTELLVATMAAADPPPPVLVNASAVGYYGHRGEEVLDESSAPGAGFLAELTQAWEAAALAACSAGTRVVLLRLGMVIARGGALGRMMLPFKVGAGGPIGSGRQWWPWIAMDDVLGVIRLALEDRSLEGAVNVVAPQEVRCREFTTTLGRVLHRPAFLPLPAVAARLALGEMADALLLASTRARPACLVNHGYTFAAPALEEALRATIR
jgi:uncharacterized protein (TIGR01777 family)